MFLLLSTPFPPPDLDISNYCDVGRASNRLVDQQEQTLQYLQFYFFGEQIIKPVSIKYSDWYADNLQYEQVRYAAYDAIMCRQIFDEIDKRGMSQCFRNNGSIWHLVFVPCDFIVANTVLCR